jgi:hypothetical protein
VIDEENTALGKEVSWEDEEESEKGPASTYHFCERC